MKTYFPKTCPKCQLTKLPKEFHKDPRNKTGLTSWCNQCRREKTKAWIKANPEKARRSRKNTTLKRVYGINLKEYEKMLEAQQYECAICRTKKPGGMGDTFVVDHCHTTGKIRKLLCSKCNCAIGLLNENPSLFDAAKKYLEEYYKQVEENGDHDPDLI